MQGVLSTMMGSLGASQNSTESIAQFIQRLSHTTNLFTPGSGDAVGTCECAAHMYPSRGIGRVSRALSSLAPDHA